MYVEVGSADTVLVICCEHLTEFRILEQSQTTKEVNLLTAPDKVTKNIGAIDIAIFYILYIKIYK